MEKSIKRYYKRSACFVLCGIFLILLPSMALTQDTYKFERMWPTLQQPWYFVWPGGVAIDAAGYVYVADTWNHRIQKFNSNGEFITKWGSNGSKSGEFSNPSGVAIDGNGFVYVMDSNNHRVQKFTFAGEFMTQWGSEGSSEGQFGGGCLTAFDCGPQGIATDKNGNVYVADTGNNRIQKFTADGVFITQWGDYGSGDGQFDYPAAIAIETSGNVYVSDTGNSRIQKFTSNGTFITKWGSQGSGDGEFGGASQASFDFDAGPQGISVDEKGNVYVADTVNKRIQQFTSDGKFVTKWGSWGPGDGQFSLPEGIAIDENGNVFVTDGSCIQKFTMNGDFISNWTNTGSGNGEFNGPQGITTDGNENVYVVDTGNNRIQKFTAKGQYITKWGSVGSADGQFQYPEGIAADANGNIYVVDAKNTRIQKFTSDGKFITKWGSAGFGDGQFGTGKKIPHPTGFEHLPAGIAADANGNVYVADTGNNRIQKFTANGQFITKWGSEGANEGEFSWPAGIAVDGSGNVYVADTGNNRIQKFTADGVFITQWGDLGSGDGEFLEADGIATDQNGNVYVIDHINNRIQKFTDKGKFLSAFGVFGSEPGGLNFPSYLCVGSTGRVYVSDASNARVQVFSSGDSGDSGGICKAIILSGGGPYNGNTLWDATQMCSNYAYRTLTYQGFTKDTIYYLSADTDLDIDGNGLFDDVDADLTNSSLQSAITTWAKDADDLLIYMTDHGGKGNFRMSETELLQAQDLNAWLDDLQLTIPGKVTLVYDACRSGSFLPLLAPPPGKERILIASTSENQSAYFTSQGTLSFSFIFWGHIFNGMNIGDAFISAKDAIEFTYKNQTPLLDDNGNGIGNENGDTALAQLTSIGNGVVSAADIPVIGSVSAVQTLNGETSALIQADNVIDTSGINKIWAVITPPNYNSGDSDKPVLTLPSVELNSVGNNKFEETYNDFSMPGTYNVSIFASDSYGEISLPKQTSVIQSAGQSCATLNANLRMTIPCLDFQGSYYQVSFDHYTNPTDTFNFFWKLDDNSIGNCQGYSSACASIDSTWQIIIPKIEFEDNFYKIVLKYYQNPNTPLGSYWMLDLASVAPL